jgi:predicted acylesterase/phospholipase RssA
MTTSPPSAPDRHPLFRILSLDGGGAKGFYTLGVLSEIEALAKRPLSQCFDLIIGTSTGAIIAALLGRGDEVRQVQSLYEEHVPTIMKNQSRRSRTKALHRLAFAVFRDANHTAFKTGVEVVATNWKDEQPFIFKNMVNQAYHSKSSFEPFFGVRIADAVIASCSAYPFFRRYTVKTSHGSIVELADGGFCANNPSLYAIADATRPLKHSPANVRLVSIGVGSYPEPPLWKQARRIVRTWSLARYVTSSDFLQKMLNTNTQSMQTLTEILFEDLPTIRINDPFREPDMATDLMEHDLNKLNRLTQKGRISFRKHEQKLKLFLEG